MLCYVVSGLVRLHSLWEVPMLQGRIPCPMPKGNLNMLPLAAETQLRDRGICTNSSRQVFIPSQ
jgi:hypothetical protein